MKTHLHKFESTLWLLIKVLLYALLLTTFIMVAVLFIMGVSSIREFAAPLMVGIVCGGYSSVCVTGALWYVMKTKVGKKAQPKKKKK